MIFRIEIVNNLTCQFYSTVSSLLDHCIEKESEATSGIDYLCLPKLGMDNINVMLFIIYGLGEPHKTTEQAVFFDIRFYMCPHL